MTINSNREALERRTIDRETVISNAVNKVAGARKVTEAQAQRRECRRTIEFKEEQKRLMDMFTLDIE